MARPVLRSSTSPHFKTSTFSPRRSFPPPLVHFSTTKLAFAFTNSEFESRAGPAIWGENGSLTVLPPRNVDHFFALHK